MQVMVRILWAESKGTSLENQAMPVLVSRFLHNSADTPGSLN